MDDGENGVVTVRAIEEIAGVIPDQTIETLLQAMQPKGRGVAAYEPVSKVVTELVADGWSASQVVLQASRQFSQETTTRSELTLLQLYNRVVFDDSISDKQKNKIVVLFSETDKRLIDGADEHLAMLDLALRVSKIFTEN
jgi:replication factor C subunit 2/4